MDLGDDDAGPELPGGFGEHEGSEVGHDWSICCLLRRGDKPSPSPVIRDGLVLPEYGDAVVRRTQSRLRPRFDHVVRAARHARSRVVS